MKSPAQNHFPHFIIENGLKWLYNPVLKKRFRDRPEERVRLAWLEYLLHQTDVKKSRIGFENPVKIPQAKNDLRADIIIYDDTMKPSILIECKAENVRLNTTAAEQAARYNQAIGAEYLVLTNGVEDLWFQCNDEGTYPVSSRFNHYGNFGADKMADYWKNRGFLKSSENPELTEFITDLLNKFWNDQMIGNRRYLAFQGSIDGLPMSHYYKIIEINDQTKLAVTIAGSGSSGQYLLAIRNEDGAATGMISVDLEMILSNENPAITIYSKGNTEVRDADMESLFSYKSKKGYLKKLPETLLNFFD
ncbi:MAG: type I restriction enzyme HsdR N-terminal domain-containing protein [Balneolaceae bacterium]|nr:MAG: type I restriction enzyme HsdR N-terminal domain-containing protein [Balneolaceae bacterium]